MIVALDIYQIVSGDWSKGDINDPLWLKFLFLGFDILGFVSAGAAAKAAKSGIMPLKAIANSPSKVAQYFQKNPGIKGIITSMIEGVKKIPALLQSVVTAIAKKAPKIANFIKGIFGKLGAVSRKFTESLQKLLGQTAGKGASVGVKTGGLLYGFETGTHSLLYGGKTSEDSLAAAKRYDYVIKNHYGGKDPFDN
jgi:hypothetical protein